MTAIALYLLKVALCSGILFLYYHLALRNKAFHQWNRFYLLAAVVLSLVLPVVHFTFLFDTANQSDVAALLRQFQQADNILEDFVVVSGKGTTTEQWLLMGYGLVSVIVFTVLILSLIRITSIIRAHTVQPIRNVKFINTDLSGTPFSFFRYIFWNRNIPLQSTTGRQIFQHEMVHVEERHSFDKLFFQVVLVFWWCNPFFWLIRKELYTIHEFIADHRSVDQNDTSAFAAMILQAAYPKHYPSLINPFFQSSIKRRIAMLTKNQNHVVSYISRMIALPLIAVTALAFTVRTNNASVIKNELAPINTIGIMDSWTNTDTVTDTLPKKTKEIRSVDVRKDDKKKISELTITYSDGTKEKMTGAEAQKKGLINNSDYGNTTMIKEKGDQEKRIQIRKSGKGENQPLYILDGKEISQEEMNKIDPTKIESVNVLKDTHATDKYGEKGKNGVVEISSKKSDNRMTQQSEPIFEQTETQVSVDKQEWRAFLEKNLQPIIESAARKGAKPGTYTVKIRFLVKKDGSVADFTALNNPYELGEEVVAIMPNSPKWNPAEQNGKAVNSYHTQPITFVIQEM